MLKLGEHRIQVPPGWTNTITDVELDITTITERSTWLVPPVTGEHLIASSGTAAAGASEALVTGIQRSGG